ncbi:hypothetical protein KSX_89170 [Ktedonospora formicarum]|uniref:Uncharacterized protein n=1 Tax=Ktedonospora formicarum TaxID=2778364 RepID=A0A8J3IGI8_9CHLR|nr:hypothetical protein KSX_89170 [Ktedonospora formicarum]
MAGESPDPVAKARGLHLTSLTPKGSEVDARGRVTGRFTQAILPLGESPHTEEETQVERAYRALALMPVRA